MRVAGQGPEHDREFLSRALLEGLSDQQFHTQLDASIGQILDASVDKVPAGR